jgi:Ca2+-dependent lipid-binding protein
MLLASMHCALSQSLGSWPCRIFLRSSHKLRTQTIGGSHHPVWNETFRLLVHDTDRQQLTLILMNHNHLEKDSELGR